MRSNWLALLPRRVPALSILLEDIGNPDPDAIAKTLGVSPSTVYRWKAKDTAPRAVLLALYYATQWGRSDVNCQAVNDARLYFGYAAALRTALEAANAKLARLGQIGDFGSANDPAPGAPATLQSPPHRPKTASKKARSQASAEPADKRLTERASASRKTSGLRRTG